MPKYCVFGVANLAKTVCKSESFFNNFVLNSSGCAKIVTKIHIDTVIYSNNIHNPFDAFLSVINSFYTLSTMPTITITNNIKG